MRENLGLTVILWQSCAIIEYIVDTYDKEHKISFSTFPEKYLTKTWLYFQASGQGPYFGQRWWFLWGHAEKLPSVLERYGNEIKRVMGVFERHLTQQEQLGEGQGQWLVGDKCSYADLSFVMYNFTAAEWLLPEGGDVTLDLRNEFPKTFAWHERMMQRASCQKSVTEMKEMVLRRQQSRH